MFAQSKKELYEIYVQILYPTELHKITQKTDNWLFIFKLIKIMINTLEYVTEHSSNCIFLVDCLTS